MSIAAMVLLPGTAAVASGTWGPDGIGYTNGVLCVAGDRTAALVSWPTSAGPHPAFAARTVTGPAPGGTGGYDEPAVSPTSTTEADFLDQYQRPALAYLTTTAGVSSDPRLVSAVAAIVAEDATVGACRAEGLPELDQGTRQELIDHADHQAGPYRVTVSSPAPVTLGQASPVIAEIRSSAGDPVPGMTVSFATDGSGVTTTATSAVTDSSGQAEIGVAVPSAWTANNVIVRASVSAPVTMLGLTAPGAVPLLTAGPDETFSGQTAIAIDTTASPVLHVRVDPTLVLPGTPVAAALDVTGLRGHVGTAQLNAVGPLPFQATTGCSGYGASSWKTAHVATVAQGITVVGDGTSAVQVGKVRDAGCYLLQAKLDTANATPAVTSYSDPADHAAVVGAAPLHIALTPDGHGVGVVGPVTAAFAVTGDVPAQLTDATGSLVGPRPARSGVCPTSGWAGATVRSAVTSSDAETAGTVEVRSDAVTDDGCYALRMDATVTVPGVGSIAVRGITEPTLVLDPQLTVTALSSPHVQTSGRIRATVEVFGTLTQAGTLHLRLARLADESHGCFGVDYRSAVAVPDVHAPSTPTTGDGSYVVTSPPVPTEGCWTVEPVLGLTANGAVQVTSAQPTSSMVAFTAVAPLVDAVIGGRGAAIDRTVPYVVAGIGAGVLLVVAVAVTLRLAFVSADDDEDD